MKPDENQLKIIQDTKNNIILYAGAGTGKTFTVANKIAYYLQNQILGADKILCLTFTVKACNELIEEIKKICGRQDVLVKTIHGFCYKVLKEKSLSLDGVYNSPDICDEVDSEIILREKCLPYLNEIAFADHLKARGAKHDLQWLKTQDIAYLNDKMYFAVKDNQGYFLISYDGKTLRTDESFKSEKSGMVCPQCKTKQKKQGNFCEVCSYDLRLSVPPFTVQVKSLRSFVSFIKRYRAILNYYSGNDEVDYQRVFDYFYNNEREKIERLLLYKERDFNKNVIDFYFLSAMQKYCGKFITYYNEYLTQRNQLDYDDLIVKTYELFSVSDYKDLPEYSLIVIDEMQDTSELEYSLISKLFSGQVMLCGDVNQSIYGWRGAKPIEILSDFKDNFNATEYHLNKNYRSNKALLDFGEKFLKNAFSEKNETLPVSLTEDEKPIIRKCENLSEEAKFIYEKCLALKGSKAILTRTNHYGKRLYERLCEIDGDLIFTSIEEEQNLLKSKIVKEFVSFLKIIYNPDDKFNVDKLFIDLIPNVGEVAIDKINLPLLAVDSSIFLNKSIYEGIDPYADLIKAFENKKVAVFDIESSGLGVEENEIIQLSAKKIDGQTFNRFIKNKKPLDEQSVKVHGFTQEFLNENGEDLLTVLKDFSAFIKDCVIVGHNSSNFDLPVLKRVYKENDLELTYLSHYDTLNLAKKIIKDVKNYKLATLCERLSIVNLKAHDAFFDVEATFKLLEYIVKILKQTSFLRIVIINKNKDKYFNFANFYNKLKTMGTSEFVSTLTNYLVEFSSVDEVVKNVNFNRLKRFTKKFNYSLPLLSAIKEFLDEKDDYFDVLKTIPILTIHQAKGMEFDNVFVAGVDNFTFPDEINSHGEQRKVFYVAISRAKVKLFLTFCNKNAFGGQNQPSDLLKLV